MKDWSKQHIYSGADFLLFLKDHKINDPTVGFSSSSDGGGLYTIRIPGFEIVHPTTDLISVSGYSLDNALFELAKKLAGKKIRTISTCDMSVDRPEPIEIPAGFGRTDADRIRA